MILNSSSFNKKKMLLIIAKKKKSPKQHNISGNRKVSLRMNDDYAVLCKSKVRVAFPAVFITQLRRIFAEIVVGGNGNGSNEFPVFGIPNDDFVLICGAEEVAVDVDGNVTGDPGQVEARVV